MVIKMLAMLKCEIELVYMQYNMSDSQVMF